MATQTDHMKLTKPAYTDSADIAVINSNMDAIDTATSKILPVISGTTNNSGYTIASGEYFEANGKLYKATASIPTNQAWSSSATEQSDHGAINALNGNIASLKKFNYVDISDSTPVNISNKASEAGVTVNAGNFIAAVSMDNEVICLPYYSSTYNKLYCALKDLNMATVTGTKNVRVYYRT